MSSVDLIYAGTALPADATTETLYDTTTEGIGNLIVNHNLSRFHYDIRHDKSGSVKGYWSVDGGTNWRQFHDSGVVPADTIAENNVLVESYKDVKFEWLNGGTTQTSFTPHLSLSTQRDAVARQPLVLPFTTGILQILDAAAANITLDSVTSRVSSWADTSGLGNDATQATDANQPVYTAANSNFPNSQGVAQPSVDGDGSAYFLLMDAIATALTGDDTPWYFITAFRIAVISQTETLWSLDDASAAAPYHRIHQRADDKYRTERDGDTGGAKIADAGTTDTDPHVFDVEFTGTAMSMWVDGTAIQTDFASDADTATGLDIATLLARRASGTAALHLDAEIANFATYSTVPSDANKTILRNAFNYWYTVY